MGDAISGRSNTDLICEKSADIFGIFKQLT